MTHMMQKCFFAKGLFAALVLLAAGIPSWGADRIKPETIKANAMGTGSQMGQLIGVELTIFEYSNDADRAVLVQAFTNGQNQGLVSALTKMRAVGHVAITGTLGYDCSYIRLIPTATGRKIRFITNRQIRFGEAFWDTSSKDFNLTGGEMDLNAADKNKSTGVLYPAAELAIDKEGQLKIELNQNAWKLVNFLDWKGTPGVN